jgi:hypothetical protein
LLLLHLATGQYNHVNAKHQFFGFLSYTKICFQQEFRKQFLINFSFGLRSAGVARCFKLDLCKKLSFFLQISIKEEIIVRYKS